LLEISDFTSRIGEVLPAHEFVPLEIDLVKNFQKDEKEHYEPFTEVEMTQNKKFDSFSIIPRYPKEKNIVALDSTSFILGQVSDGLVCAIRASIIVKPANESVQRLELYGPYLPVITYHNSDNLYDTIFRTVYKKPADSKAPDIYKMPDRMRNLFERYLQNKICKEYSDSVILFDGSLIGDTIANPKGAIEEILDNARRNNNCIVAISKSTTLTLKQSRKNILSLVDSFEGPVSVPGVREHISQNRERYLGDIFVVKLLYQGEPFRVDIDPNTSISHKELLEMVAGLSGDYGYPEELKLAHTTCILSSLEILECQAVATETSTMVIEENLRQKLFPLG